MTDSAKRHKLADLMDLTVKYEPRIHYREYRPMDVPFIPLWRFKLGLRAGKSYYMDCSEGVTALCKWAGLKNPNTGTSEYTPYGNTDTIYNALTHYKNPANALVGALVVWGHPGATVHVAMVRKPDPHNPLLWSHGQERGPLFVDLETENAIHGGQPYTFCSIAKL